MKNIGIVLNNGCCFPNKDYRIFDYLKAKKENKFKLLSQQGYRLKKEALKDAKIMGIKIRRNFEL